MQERVAPVDDYQFDIEVALSKQLGAKPLPFVGMDSMFILCREHQIRMPFSRVPVEFM